MKTDLEIAQNAKLLPIEEIAWKLGLGVEEIIPYGDGMAKIRWSSIESRLKNPQGFLVLVVVFAYLTLLILIIFMWILIVRYMVL